MNVRSGFVGFTLLLLLGAASSFGQAITNFNPKFGTNGDMVMIQGTGFGGTSKIYFWDGDSPDALATIFVNNPNEITVTIIPTTARTGPLSVQNGAGPKNQSLQNFNVVGQGPLILNFSPTFGSGNEPVTITGVHLATATSVRFSGTNAAFTGTTDGQQINTSVPANARVGTNFISVTSPQGSYTNPNPFIVLGPGPYVTNFTPIAGTAGQLVILQGVHFITGGATGVNFNGKPGTTFFVNNDNQLQVNAPSGVTTGPLTVLSSLGPAFNYVTTSNFMVPPVITGFTPSSGRVGTNVLITGSNFLGATAVVFSGTGGPFTLPVSPVVFSNSAMQVTVPAGVVDGQIRVETPAFSFTTSSNFLVPPTIFNFSPTFGRAGTNVIVTGANFNVGTPTVRFGGANAAVSGVTFGQLTATVPAGASNAPVTVITTSGSNTTSQIFYLFPVIANFAPTNSAPGTTVTITGQNLLGATNVTFNGANANIIAATNNTSLFVAVPNGVITGPINVTTPGGLATNAALFYGVPVINSFTPTHGVPTTVVNIKGTNFFGTSAVQFSGTNGSFTVVHNGQINATVPGDAFTGPIKVIAPAGTATSASPFVIDFLSDLTATVVVSPNPAFVSNSLTYSITISNSGPITAPGVALTNLLPGSVQLIAAATTTGSLNTNQNPVTATFGSMSVAGFATVTLVVVPQTAGLITNTLNAASGYSDPTPADAAAVIITPVFPTPVLAIERYSSTQVQISWPAALTNFALQFNTSLQPANAWTNVGTPPLTVGDQRVVIDSIGPATKYYRLKR
jgi:large repetitive protein